MSIVSRQHGNKQQLARDLAGRTGRSILHDLDDKEIEALIAYIEARLPASSPIIEKDRWTLWSAVAR